MKATYLVPVVEANAVVPPPIDTATKLGMHYAGGGGYSLVSQVPGADQVIVLIDASEAAHAQFAADFIQIEIIPEGTSNA